MCIDYLSLATRVKLVLDGKQLRDKFSLEESGVLSDEVLKENFKRHGIIKNLDEFLSQIAANSTTQHALSDKTEGIAGTIALKGNEEKDPNTEICTFNKILVLLLAKQPMGEDELAPYLKFTTDFPLSLKEYKTYLTNLGFSEKNQTLKYLAEILSALFENIKVVIGLLRKGVKFSARDIENAMAISVYDLNFQTAGSSEQLLNLAVLCYRYGVAVESFPKAVDSFRSTSKQCYDFMPDITVDCSELGMSNIYFAKLPLNDLRGFALGRTSQSVGIAEFTGIYCIFRQSGKQQNITADEIIAISNISFSQEGHFILQPLKLVEQKLIFSAQVEFGYNISQVNSLLLQAFAVHVDKKELGKKTFLCAAGEDMVTKVEGGAHFKSVDQTSRQHFLGEGLDCTAEWPQYLVIPDRGYLITEQDITIANVNDVVRFYADKSSEKQQRIFKNIAVNVELSQKLTPRAKCLLDNYNALTENDKKFLIIANITCDDLDKISWSISLLCVIAIFKEKPRFFLDNLRGFITRFPLAIPDVVSNIESLVDNLEDLENKSEYFTSVLSLCAEEIVKNSALVPQAVKLYAMLDLEKIAVLFAQDCIKELRDKLLCFIKQKQNLASLDKDSALKIFAFNLKLKRSLLDEEQLVQLALLFPEIQEEAFLEKLLSGATILKRLSLQSACEFLWQCPETLEDTYFPEWLSSSAGVLSEFLFKKLQQQDIDCGVLLQVYSKAREKLPTQLSKLILEKLEAVAKNDARLSFELANWWSFDPTKQRNLFMQVISIVAIHGHGEQDQAIAEQAKQVLLKEPDMKVLRKNIMTLYPREPYKQLEDTSIMKSLVMGHCYRKGRGDVALNLPKARGFFSQALTCAQASSDEKAVMYAKQQLILTQSEMLLEKLAGIKEISVEKNPQHATKVEFYNKCIREIMSAMEYLKVHKKEEQVLNDFRLVLNETIDKLKKAEGIEKCYIIRQHFLKLVSAQTEANASISEKNLSLT